MSLLRSTKLPGQGLRLLSLQRGTRRLYAPSRAAIPLAASSTSTAVVASPARALSSSAPQLQKRKPRSRLDLGPPPEPLVSSPPRPEPPPPVKTLLPEPPREPSPKDPLNLGPLEAALESVDATFKSQLRSVLWRGSYDVARIGAMPVLVKPEPGDAGAKRGRGGADDDDALAPRSFALRNLAQVVPRSSRAISLLVNDVVYIKPIMSALQASPDFNQQPQRKPGNNFELLLRHEPPRREELLGRVKRVAQVWRDDVRWHRAKHDKLLKEWRRSGAVLPDVGRRAEKMVQKLQDEKMKDIDFEEASAVKQLLK